MEINFKEGTPFRELKPITYEAIFVCAQVFNKKQLPLVITATTDGEHMENSFHYTGEAFDIRIRRLTVVEQISIFNQITRELQQLSRCFQTVLEEDHIHVEFDWR
tara:strand:+ start:1538 stop:1852 length:315 start_codon:yes stop_codon:yes gene_type:complete